MMEMAQTQKIVQPPLYNGGLYRDVCVVLLRMISRTFTTPLFLSKERENTKAHKGRDGHNPALLMVRQGLCGLQKGAECKAAAGTNKTTRHGEEMKEVQNVQS